MGPDELMNPVVFQCASCRTVLSDTLGYLISSDPVTSTVCVSEARMVSVQPTIVASRAGWDEGYSYKGVVCAACDKPLGRMYTTTRPEHDSIRGAYVLQTEALVSYQLGSLSDAAIERTPSKQVIQSHHDNEAFDYEHARSTERRSRRVFPSDSNMQETGTRLHKAFDELDNHVGKLTTASNQMINAQKRLDTGLSQLLRDFATLEERQSSCETDVGACASGLRDVDAELVKIENLFLKWENRFKAIEAVLPSVAAHRVQQGLADPHGGTPLTVDQQDTATVGRPSAADHGIARNGPSAGTRAAYREGVTTRSASAGIPTETMPRSSLEKGRTSGTDVLPASSATGVERLISPRFGSR